MPRPRDTSPAAAGIGAAFGALLGGPAGAALGGLLGGAAGTSAVPLEEALRRKLQERGWSLGGVRRSTRFEIHVLCIDEQGRYWPVVAKASPRAQSPDELDDLLYDIAVDRMDRLFSERPTSTNNA